MGAFLCSKVTSKTSQGWTPSRASKPRSTKTTTRSQSPPKRVCSRSPNESGWPSSTTVARTTATWSSSGPVAPVPRVPSSFATTGSRDWLFSSRRTSTCPTTAPSCPRRSRRSPRRLLCVRVIFTRFVHVIPVLCVFSSHHSFVILFNPKEYPWFWPG